MTVNRIRERSVETELVARVAAAGGVAWKVRFTGQRGCPDRLVLLPGGKIFLVETKRPRGGVVSANQSLVHATCRGLGVEVAILRSRADIDIWMTNQRL